ncbi:hypothetical protein [Neobacillus soli]|uniref:hypothetical protein n=1 Tax=Neobacillus soli TaxID=220688 RepID=UPI000825D39A|nr:hypothetical protein [Neobacillus soli]
MSTDTTKIARIFEYLLAVKNLKETIIRNVNDYEQVWWERDIPQIDGFYIGGSRTIEEAWYEIHKQEIPSVPPIPAELKDWVIKLENPEQTPIAHDFLAVGNDEDRNERIELFEEDSNRKNHYDQWIAESENLVSEASPKMKIQQLYSKG